MSHSDYENSRAKGHPVNLFLFRYGSDPAAFYACTDAENEIVLNDIAYQPMPMDASALTTDGRLDDSEFQIKVSKDHPIAQMMRFYPTSSVISLVMRQGHIPDPDAPSSWAEGILFPVAFIGSVVDRTGGGAVNTLNCVPSGAGLSRPGLTKFWQTQCPLALYGPRCLANKAAATTTGTVASTAGNRITFAPGWMKEGVTGAGYYGGILEWVGPYGPEYRMILNVLGDTVVTNGPTAGLLADAAEVAVSLGCPHNIEGCEDLHDNFVNYGGYPWIPGENPVNKNTHD